jgi:exodeoxyribonuclease V gamma subunit
VFFKDVLPAWPGGAWKPAAIPSWIRLTGLLPPGRAGEQAWRKELQAIDAAMAAARAPLSTLNAEIATQVRQESVDVGIDDPHSQAPQRYRIAGGVGNVFPLDAGDARGMQLVRAFPTIKDSAGRLKSENDLHFGERVAVFLDWALLRLQTARSDAPLAPVRVALLTAGSEKPWQDGFQQWDEALLRAEATQRQAMLDDLQSRVAKLIRWWHEAQRKPHWYFARTSWAAVAPSKMKDVETGEAALPETGDSARLEAIRKAWSDHDDRGERDHGKGYNRLFAGDAAFGADTTELAQLLAFANDLRDAISLDARAPA